MHRRGTALVAMAILTALAPPAGAAPPLVTKTFVLHRTTNGPTSFQLNVSLANDTRGSFIGAIGARVVRGRVVSATTSWAGSARRWQDSTVNAGGAKFSTCQVGVCHDDRIDGWHGLTSNYSDDGGDDAFTHVFVTLVGKTVTWRLTAKGWALHPMPLSFRYLDGGETSPAYAHAETKGVEVYQDGSLPGGRRGSLAVGIPPCSMATTGLVARGAGSVTLDGGVEPESFTCPTSRVFPASFALGPTTWRLHGFVAGESTGVDTRLFVVDLPARLP